MSSSPSTAVMVVAVLGLVLSAVSLTWQVATFRLNGPRLRATLRAGTAGFGLTTVPVGPGWQDAVAQLVRQGRGEPVLALELRNTGRAAATVTGFRAVLDNRMSWLPTTQPAGAPTLPHRVDAEDAVTLWMPLADCVRLVEAAALSSRPARRLRLVATLGSGREVGPAGLAAQEIVTGPQDP